MAYFNIALAISVILPFATKDLLFQKDPLLNDIKNQFKSQFANDYALDLKTKYENGNISRTKGKAIVDLEFCDQNSCKKLLVSAERRHFVWFYDDIYVNQTKRKNITFKPFDDPLPSYYDIIPLSISYISFLTLIYRLAKKI